MTVLIASIAIVWLNFLNYPSNAISYDVFGYYMYLPQLFINHDLKLDHVSEVLETINYYRNTSTFYQAGVSPEGDMVMKYTAGMAILYLPFFFLGHLLALVSFYPSDGYSAPYQFAIIFGGICYSIAGIWTLRNVLRRYFSDNIVAATIFILVFGTNYLFHSSIHGQGTMPHNFLFTAYAAILWLTIEWHKEHKLSTIILLGLACGLNMLSRPSEAICVLIPALWGVTDIESLKERFHFLLEKKAQILIFIGIIFLIGSVQMAYWKYASGQFLYYSYRNAGEGFEFLDPYLFKVLFSFRKGWLLYTPLMIFAIWGFVYMYRQTKELFTPVFVFFLMNLYIVSSWSCWWYAESFSQRSLIQSYAVMAFPLGYFLNHIDHLKTLKKIIWIGVIVLLIALNLFQSWQAANNVINTSRMTSEAYFAVFGRKSLPEGYFEMLLINRSFEGEEKMPDTRKYDSDTIMVNRFEAELEDHNFSNKGYNGTRALELKSHSERSPELRVPYSEISSNYYAWIKVSFKVFSNHDFSSNPTQLIIGVEHKHRSYKYLSYNLDTRNIKVGEWNEVSFEYLTPEIRDTDDDVRVFLEHLGNESVLIDDLVVEVYNEVYD